MYTYGLFVGNKHITTYFPASYYYHIAQALVESGYKRNVNIRGVPYDFRRAPSKLAVPHW